MPKPIIFSLLAVAIFASLIFFAVSDKNFNLPAVIENAGQAGIWSWTNKKNAAVQKTAKNATPKKKPVVPSTPAAPTAPTAPAPSSGLENAQNLQLRKLAEYQKICGSLGFEKIKIFTNFPTTESNASKAAKEMASTLKETASFGISPIVIVEPVNAGGSVLSFADIAAGKYDAALEKYFSELKNQNVSETALGIWTPLSEPNVNEWGAKNNNPQDFVAAFNRFAAIFKKNFAGGQLSVLLDNYSYDAKAGEFNAVPLVPYLTGLEKQYISSFVLQGFPWPEKGVQYSASDFLNRDIALSAAQNLGVKSIWFNTGTFASGRDDYGNIITMSVSERQTILNGILDQANQLKSLGYQITVNLFAQDKSQTQEGIDWSYLKDSQSRQILCDFISRARSLGIALSLYDE